MFLLSAFLIGGIPTGYAVVKALYHKDIRNIGSGNSGTTNVKRNFGFYPALITATIDILKSSSLVFLAGYFFEDMWMQIFVASLLVLGNIFSPFLKFKGGKGVATAFGTLFVVSPLDMFFLFIIWFTFLKISRIMSLMNLILVLIIPFLLIRRGEEWFIYGVFLVAILFYSHRENIKRLIKKEEPKLKV
jgi:glycerol-3-phosphate acyltransferase PlsY